ncbi:MAG TPA: MlaD family protein [Ignavibacteriales bacterium]|nr:MlaD family protein [Ignavibacteriales bacterium]
MKDQRRTNIKVGISALAGLILLIWLFAWAKNIGVRSDKVTLHIEFTNVAGLETGDPVTVNGLRKGFVDDLKIKGNKVLMTALVDSDVDLRSDAKFGIMMLDLMGGKKMEINPGEAPGKLDISKTLKGNFYADIPEVMAMLGSVQDDLLAIIRDGRTTLSSMNEIVGDPSFSAEVKTSLSNVSAITAKLNGILDENKDNIKTISEQGASLTTQLNQLTLENKDKISQVLSETQSAIKNEDALIQKFNKLADETAAGNNNAGKLLYDRKIMSDLEESLTTLKELTRILVEQLKDSGLNVDIF